MWPEDKYVVTFGLFGEDCVGFDTFEQALSDYRRRWAARRKWETCDLFGPGFDGECDGLTTEQREAVRCL